MNEQPIDDLDLPIRGYKRISRYCHTVGELLKFSFKDLLEIKGIGVKRALEIQECLVQKGLKLKDSASPVILKTVSEKSFISCLNLSKRVYSRLLCNGIYTISDLLECTVADLKDMRGLGTVGINEIQVKLEDCNLRLKD